MSTNARSLIRKRIWMASWMSKMGATMAWWKCSSALFWCEEVQRIYQSYHNGDHANGSRIYIFAQLLNITADGQIVHSASELSARTRASDRQCGIVWSCCIDSGVLQRDGDGYSARVWMTARGLLPDSGENLAAVTHETARAGKQTTDAQNAQPEATETKKKASTRELKEQVRPNVRLSRKEIDALKSQYTDEQITKMLDKLSEYKTQNNRNYTSDYQAIERWVVKWLNDDESAQPHPQVMEFPSWCTGKK